MGQNTPTAIKIGTKSGYVREYNTAKRRELAKESKGVETCLSRKVCRVGN